jgi:hypothetical protein
MKKVAFYVDYNYEVSSDEYGSNLVGRYGFSIDCSDEIYDELYQIWDENGGDLNSWNTNWDGHDSLYHSINQIATKMLNEILEENKSGIRNISSLDVLWEITKETIDEFETRS